MKNNHLLHTVLKSASPRIGKALAHQGEKSMDEQVKIEGHDHTEWYLKVKL